MTDLYETLGVSKDAPVGEIRKAYRKAAKAAHPDGGGSVEKFALVKLAADTLGDEARRARYDQTGQAEESGPDQTEGNARQTAFQAIEAVIGMALQRGLDVEKMDVIKDASMGLTNKLAEIDEAVRKAEKEHARAVKIAARLKVKPGKPDILGPMMQNRITGFKDAIRQQGAGRPTVVRALAILNDHAFDYEREQQSRWTQPAFLGTGIGLGV